MKKYTLFLILGIFTSVFAQEGINFEKETFKNILAKAKKENKLIFLDAYTSWCGPCKMLEKNIFPQKEAGDYYNANFINARFDMEKDEGIELAKKYSVTSYPTLLFLNSQGEVVHRSAGYIGIAEFLQLGKDANLPDNRMGSLKERFEKGESNPDFLINIIKLYVYSDYELAKKASERYFKTKKTPDISRDEAGILLYFIKSTQDENYKIFQEKKSEILKYIPENVYQDFDKSIKISEILKKAIDTVHYKIDDQYFLTETSKFLNDAEAQNILNRVKLNYYLNIKNFIEYEKTAVTYYQTPENFEATELNNVSSIFLKNINNLESLKKAINWSLAAVKKEQNFTNTITLSNLYQKMGDQKNAEFWKNKSADLSKNTVEQKNVQKE